MLIHQNATHFIDTKRQMPMMSLLRADPGQSGPGPADGAVCLAVGHTGAAPRRARIAAADAYSAMTADRPYHSPRSVSEAIAELHRCAGTQFDPVVVALVDELHTAVTTVP